MAIQGRKFSGSSGYRYGFNAKENDLESGTIDFGARAYDARLGRWLSIDPNDKSYPFMSPYVGLGNNPIYFIDPTGGFLIDVHRRIVQNAFVTTSKGKSKETDAYRTAILGTSMYNSSVAAPDVRALPKWLGGGGQTSVDYEHFDNMNFQQITANFEKVFKKIDADIIAYQSSKITATGLGNKIGEYMHAVQDFYSHSNYIELYAQTFGKTDFSKIPTLEEAMTLPEFKDFAKLLSTDLKTGKYPGTGEGSHSDMNHDLGSGSSFWYLPEVINKAVNWNTKAAEAVSVKATINITAKVEDAIIQKENK